MGGPVLWLAGLLASLPLGASVGAGLISRNETPLRTQGRFIINRGGERVKWACVNWYGAYSETIVPGGLEEQPLAQIVQRIVDLKFNCVRLCYSTQAQLENAVVQDENVAANPQFFGKRFFDVWDATVEALTDAGLMVMVNNHLHANGWCCHYTQVEGLWYRPGYSEEVWIDSLVNMTLRHKSNPLVVAIDLRNEVHDWENVSLTWGDGNPQTDWAAAATRAGNAVLAANPDVLVVVMALCFGMELRPVADHPIVLNLPDRVVYQTHNYLEYQLWHLVSASFTSWESIRWTCGLLLLLPSAVNGGLWVTWKKVGRPLPPRPASVATFGGWLCGLGIVTAIVCQIFMFVLTRNPGCGYWARRDVLPALRTAACLAALGLVVALGTWVWLLWNRRRLRAAGKGSGSSTAGSPTGDMHSIPPTTPDSEIGVVCVDDDDDGTTTDGEEVSPEGCCCIRGCGSCRIAAAHLTRKQRDGAQRIQWDCGMCCALQCSILCSVFALLMVAMVILGLFGNNYVALQTHFDRAWGYVLDEGQPFTAPVVMGEFGSPVPGAYWNHLMHYLNERDVDYAYWAINGKKWATGFIDVKSGGTWVPYPAGKWENETFGVLEEDYWTVRGAWKLMDLQMLAHSPAAWRPQRPYCDRKVMGSSCGG